ncbi:unnamed protein product [Urochloa humidicola]
MLLGPWQSRTHIAFLLLVGGGSATAFSGGVQAVAETICWLAAAVASSTCRILHPPPPKPTGSATPPVRSRTSGVEIHRELTAVSSSAETFLWMSSWY